MPKIIKTGIKSLKFKPGFKHKDPKNIHLNFKRTQNQINVPSNNEYAVGLSLNNGNQNNPSHNHQRSFNSHFNSKVKEIYQFSHSNNLLQAKMKNQNLQITNSLLQKVEQLKYTAAYNKVISLSANQIDISSRIFVILKRNLILTSKWKGYDVLDPIKSYDTIINPQLLTYSEFKYKADQECPTFQGLKFKIWVALMNQFKYFKLPQKFQNGMKLTQNQKSNQKEQKHKQKQKTNLLIEQKQKLTGFYGRVFDHQYRHLQGLLLNNLQISAGQCYLNDQFKTNPQNYDYLNQMRQQQKYFLSGNFQKQIKKSIKQNQSKLSSKTDKNFQSAQRISQKITPQMKENLVKGYKDKKQTKKRDNQKSQSQQKLNENQKHESQKKKKLLTEKKILQRQIIKITEKYYQDQSKPNVIQEKIKGLSSLNKQENLIIKNKSLTSHRNGKKKLNISNSVQKFEKDQKKNQNLQKK